MMNTNDSEKIDRNQEFPPDSFYRLVYSEIEEVGWEHLVKLDNHLAYLCFRVLDTRRQSHILEIHIPQNYPRHAPSISADVPFICELNWLPHLRLKDVVHQFREHLEKCQEIWSTLDHIDNTLWVVSSRRPSRAASVRQINLGNDCSIVLFINAQRPSSLPECRFLGPNSLVDSLRKTWRRNSKRWMKDTPFSENLANVLGSSLLRPTCVESHQHQVECGICYAQNLPVGKMMSLGQRVEVGLTIRATIPAAVELFIVCVLGIGCVSSQQQGSHLMFYLATVLIVQDQLLSKATPVSRFLVKKTVKYGS